MVEWVIIDRKGRKRKAKPEEIPKCLIDNSAINPEDGDLIFPERTVRKHDKKK